MEITNFVLSGRDQALLYGDYSTYRAQLSRQLLAIRKKVGRTTKKGAKFTSKVTVTAQDIASNHEFARLLLLTSERAWAHAMYMKSAHSAETKGITGSTRSHIISRLHKASKIALELLQILEDVSISKAIQIDILETRAYVSSLVGAEEFERQRWEACVRSYSVSWAIYTALATTTKSDSFKDLLSGTIEPSIRYGAYQIRVPRTVAILAIVRKYFPRTDTELVSVVDEMDSEILKISSKIKAESADSESSSRIVKWRSRHVALEDASIAVALASVASAKRALEETLSLTSTGDPKGRAAAYDEILIASQDVVDATKHAIDETVAEGINQSDKRMQSLQITRTAVSYDMISWRIGRNRVLTGERDGALPDADPIAKPRKRKKADVEIVEKEEGVGRKISRLREKLVLYDSTLQSLDSIMELPGVAADTVFVQELEAKHNYFRALKCLAIARSHSALLDYKNALALLFHATELLSKTLLTLSPKSQFAASTSVHSAPTLSFSNSTAKSLSDILEGELQRHRALVELSNLTRKSINQLNSTSQGRNSPLIERLNTYPTEGVDLSNLVTYPPKLEPIPVNPLFLDVAFNYIQYPGQEFEKGVKDGPVKTSAKPSQEKEQEQAATPQQRKGWFGFGR